MLFEERTFVANDNSDWRLRRFQQLDVLADLHARNVNIDATAGEDGRKAHLLVTDDDNVVVLAVHERLDRLLRVADDDSHSVLPEPLLELLTPVLCAVSFSSRGLSSGIGED